MPRHSDHVLNKRFIDAARAGCANASESLRTLANDRLSMVVLWVGSVPTVSLGELSGNAEDLVVGVYVAVAGDLPGHALLMFPLPSAMMLADFVLNLEIGTTTEIGEMETSIVKEVANILTSSYLTAISDRYDIVLMPSPPMPAVDMAAAIIDSVLITSGHFEAETISIVTRFRGTERSIDGFFLYIPEAEAAAEGEAA